MKKAFGVGRIVNGVMTFTMEDGTVITRPSAKPIEQELIESAYPMPRPVVEPILEPVEPVVEFVKKDVALDIPSWINSRKHAPKDNVVQLSLPVQEKQSFKNKVLNYFFNMEDK